MVGAEQKSKPGGRGDTGGKKVAALQLHSLHSTYLPKHCAFYQFPTYLESTISLNFFIAELASSCSKGEGKEAGGRAAGEVEQAAGRTGEAQVI